MRLEPLTTPQHPRTVGLSPGEKLLALVLAAIAAAGAFAWLVGQLAGLLFAHTWLHVGAADMAQVLWHLPKHPGDPALAWPARFRHALPGPVGMYLCTALVIGALLALSDLAIRLWPGQHAPRLGVPLLPHRNHQRAATWASGWELRGLVVRRPTPGRVILGRTRGVASRLLAAEDCHSVFVFGPTGSLKTTGVVIPAIKEWTGPLVATSVKPDVIRATRAHRRRRGEVLVIDPLRHSGLPAAQWSPLAACGTWQDAQVMAGIIADTAALSDRPTDEVKYWRTLGTKLLAPLLYAAANGGWTMADVVRWVDTREEQEVVKALAEAGSDGAANAWEASQQRTDQDHLGLGLVGVVEQAGELARADHAGLIHQQDRVRVESVAALLQVSQQPIDRARIGKSLVGEPGGGKAGWCRPYQAVPLQAVGMRGRPGHEGLAIAGLANQQRHASARARQVRQRVGLVLRHGRERLQGGAQVLRRHHRAAGVRPGCGAVQHPLFQRH